MGGDRRGTHCAGVETSGHRTLKITFYTTSFKRGDAGTKADKLLGRIIVTDTRIGGTYKVEKT